MTDTWGLTEEVVRRFHDIIVSVMKKLIPKNVVMLH